MNPEKNTRILCFVQIFGFWFYYWHPSSSSLDVSIAKKWYMKYSCILGKWSRSPDEFANATAFYIGGPLKLIFVPSIVIAIIEVKNCNKLLQNNKDALRHGYHRVQHKDRLTLYNSVTKIFFELSAFLLDDYKC